MVGRYLVDILISDTGINRFSQMTQNIPFYPGQVPVDAYGNGGFRFADMSHRGSILCLPSGILAWDIEGQDEINLKINYEHVVSEAEQIEILLLGTGVKQIFPQGDTRLFFENAGVQLEAMDTGAACRTYNVLLAEQRRVAAALIAVD